MISTLALAAALTGAQAVVESATPRDADLTLAEEPRVRIGALDGPLEYIFGEVTGAVRLDDGSIVVVDEQSDNVRRYDANGRHLWTSGREGDGPGEYRGLRLLRHCPGATITVFDWVQDRITQLDLDGNVVDTRTLNATGVNPYGEPACSTDGRLVFTPWPEDRRSARERAVGEQWRWRVSLRVAVTDSVTVLQSGIPGAERTRISRGTVMPSYWGRTMVFATVGTGVWFGASGDYELQHLDWTGRVTRTARWAGPDLAVTDDCTSWTGTAPGCGASRCPAAPSSSTPAGTGCSSGNATRSMSPPWPSTTWRKPTDRTGGPRRLIQQRRREPHSSAASLRRSAMNASTTLPSVRFRRRARSR